MIPTSSLTGVLSLPTPEALWRLRADLLEGGFSPDAPMLEIIGEFRAFLDHFATSTSSRDLNHLASKLDIGAIGGVVLEQLFESPDSKELAMRVLTGGISEGLMVLASRQYVRVAEGELAALFRISTSPRGGSCLTGSPNRSSMPKPPTPSRPPSPAGSSRYCCWGPGP